MKPLETSCGSSKVCPETKTVTHVAYSEHYKQSKKKTLLSVKSTVNPALKTTCVKETAFSDLKSEIFLVIYLC